MAHKKRRISDIDNSDEPPFTVECRENSGLYNVQPLHMISEWIEPGTTTKRLTVAILLPSGVLSGQFAVRVADDGCALEISITWPNPMVELKMLHRKWLQADGSDRIEVYHPKLIGFERFLKSYRTRSTDKIESTARINLPYQVQTHISEKFNLG